MLHFAVPLVCSALCRPRRVWAFPGCPLLCRRAGRGCEGRSGRLGGAPGGLQVLPLPPQLACQGGPAVGAQAHKQGFCILPLQAFIVARDLYVSPLAVVGCGMGAAAGLALAQAAPFLLGALLAAEFALPADAAAAAAAGEDAAGGGDAAREGALEAANGCASPAAPGGAARACSGSSKELLPWWGFRVGQASAFASVEQCAAFLAHPLANLAPGLLVPLEAAAARQVAADARQVEADAAVAVGSDGASSASSCDSCSDCDSPNSPSSYVRGAAATGGQPGKAQQDGQAGSPAAPAAPPLRELFAQLQRPLRGAVASACSLVRLPAWLAEGRPADYWEEEEEYVSGGGGLQPRMDPSFHFTFDPSALLRGLSGLRCHLLLLRGGRASWADADDAAAMAAAAAGGGAASAAIAELPGAGHWLAADHPEQLLLQVVAFLEGPAVRCFDRRPLPSGAQQGAANGCSSAGASSAGARRPELLGLRPLPEYSTLEEAQKVMRGHAHHACMPGREAGKCAEAVQPASG